MTTAALAGRRPAPRPPGRAAIVVLTLLVWAVAAALLWGQWTLSLARSDLTPLHRWLNEVNDAIGANRNTSPVFVYVFNVIRLVVGELTELFQALVSQPAFGRPVPVVGWLGVVAVTTYGAWALGNARVALLAAAGFTFIGVQGLWQEGMDTLALTLSAVLLSVLLGIPLGIAAGLWDGVNRPVSLVLDFMQTMPSLVYLAPLALVFLIGPASATIATLVYAMPPTVRYTAHAMRTVPAATVEASASLGATSRQQVTGVLLPLSRPTIVLGISQTIMAALAMVTIAALIDAPGLGKTVLKALTTVDVGTAFNAGLAIVVLAIVLDRMTTAFSRRAEISHRRPPSPLAARLRRPLLVAGAAGTLFAVYHSRTYLWAAEFPETVTVGGRERDVDIGNDLAKAADGVTQWISLHWAGVTNGIKDFVTGWLLNPLESLLTQSPWFVVAAVVVTLAAVLGNRRAALVAAACLTGIIGTGLWGDAMTTLAATLVATVATVVLGVVVGVWMGRSPRADQAIRPVLDAAQTMPAFVYLVPFLALFDPSRFTAIAAAVVYAAPVSIKIVADGIAGIPKTAVEAATAAGSTSWQTITKVQLPMARESLTLAVNQGLCYVLAMVVVGGLVGAGALGYDVVAGFSQGELFGKGLAAGLAIVLLGILLDRITRAAAGRTGRTRAPRGVPSTTHT
jgi:glycine betaine/proline transport system permease protein